MSAGNRAADVQLAALQPDDQVAVETSGEFRGHDKSTVSLMGVHPVGLQQDPGVRAAGG